MKQTFNLFRWAYAIIIIVFTTSLYSCKKGDKLEPVETISDKQIISIYSSIGEIHNSGLDVVYNELQKQNFVIAGGNNSKVNHDKMYSLIDKSVKEFVHNRLNTKNIDLNPFIDDNNSNNPIKEYLNKDLVSQIKYLKQAEGLSNEFFQLMDQLNVLVDNDALKVEFDNLMNNGISKLNDYEEKVKFVSCISIGYSSLQYWKNNISKWHQLFSNDKSYLIKSSSSNIIGKKVKYSANTDGAGTAIGKADITGIITGAVGGCAYGAVGGTTVLPGVGTLAGCAALGSAGAITVGLSNSAKAAVESFVNWLTS